MTGRAECFLARTDNAFEETVRRLNAYREAGADVLYAPGQQDPAEIAALVRAVDGPINVVVGRKDTPLTVDVLAEAGVKRVSIGGALFHACYGYLRNAAEEMRDKGTFNWSSTVLDRSYLKDAIAAGEALR